LNRLDIPSRQTDYYLPSKSGGSWGFETGTELFAVESVRVVVQPRVVARGHAAERRLLLDQLSEPCAAVTTAIAGLLSSGSIKGRPAPRGAGWTGLPARPGLSPYLRNVFQEFVAEIDNRPPLWSRPRGLCSYALQMYNFSV